MQIKENLPLMGKQFFAAAGLAVTLIVFPAFTSAQTPANPPNLTQPSLAAQVVDPTAPLKELTFWDTFSPSLWGIDDKINEVDFRARIPHDAFGLSNILRITVPYVTSDPSGIRGLNDVELLNIFLYPNKWGTIAAGGVVSAGANKGPGINTAAIGPVLGVVVKKNKWTYGLFNQNFFSFGDIAITQLQPVFAYTFNDKFSIAYGDTAQCTVDWKKNKFVEVPLSAEVNFISSIPKQTVRYFINPQYNIVNETGTRKWSITAGISFIVK